MIANACRLLHWSVLVCVLLALGWMQAAAANAATASTNTPASAQIKALVTEGRLPPVEVLRQLRALAAQDPAPSPALRDQASLATVQTLLDIGRIKEAQSLAQAMLADRERATQPLPLVRARLALLRVRLRQSDIKAASVLANTILASRPAFANDPLAPDVFSATASALVRAGDYRTAAGLYFDGLKAADRFDRKDQKAYLLVGLCSLNRDLHNSAKALDYCQQGAALADATGNKMARAAVAINLASCYADQHDSAQQLAELEKSLALSREMGLKRAEGMAQINLAEYTMTRNDFKAGLAHNSEGLRIGRELGDPIMVAVSLTNQGSALAELGDVAGGVKLYEQGIKAAEDAGEKSYVVDFLGGMADLYEKAGRLPDALKAMRRRVEEGDALYQHTQTDALAALQAQYEADKRQREIRLLTLDNRLKSTELERRNLQSRTYWLFAAVLVLAGLLLILAYRRVRNTNRALVVQNVQLKHHSLTDPLTGLFNRRALDAFLGRSKPGAAPRQPLPPRAFVMIDADHFKQINDHYGHSCGDAVLIELAHRLTRLVRPEDRLFRLGGEEFMLLLAGISNEDLTNLCRRVLVAVNGTPVNAEDRSIALTVSLGACRFPLTDVGALAQDWRRHLHLADLALYRAKATGRNRAIQILALADAGEATLRQIETDFPAAQAANRIDTVVIEGAD